MFKQVTVLSLLLHRASCRLVIYYTPTNALLHYNSLKFFYIKTLKMLLHVSILRSPSGSTFCTLLKFYVKKLIILSNVSVMRQHVVCMCVCRISCRGSVDGQGDTVGYPCLSAMWITHSRCPRFLFFFSL